MTADSQIVLDGFLQAEVTKLVAIDIGHKALMPYITWTRQAQTVLADLAGLRRVPIRLSTSSQL